jgi:hypothetical protein
MTGWRWVAVCAVLGGLFMGSVVWLAVAVTGWLGLH